MEDERIRSAACIVDNKILLVRNLTKNKDTWVLPGESVEIPKENEKEESQYETISRGLKKIFPLNDFYIGQDLGCFSGLAPSGGHFINEEVYRAMVNEEPAPVHDSALDGESWESKWFSMNMIASGMEYFSETTKKVLTYLKEIGLLK